jgi:hypothetical protein
MITDSDIKKLKAVFATKDDLMSMRSDITSIKSDITSIKSDITSIKSEMISMEKRLKKEIVGDIVTYLQDNIILILNEHEKRLDRLEKHVGGFPSIT